jgi:threonine/homoserine/homoserine lactone efflux protein
MIDWVSFPFFLMAALVIALTPGPGILYVAARTLSGGRSEGFASVLGTGLGGFVHVTAGSLGVSALVMASAEAFTALKFLGAIYLVYLGIKTWRTARLAPEFGDMAPSGAQRAFREGVMVEALNPKTAAFFLAFIPQFVDLHQGSVALQFITLGLISVLLNTAVDAVVVHGATSLRMRFLRRPNLIRRLRQTAGGIMCLLGISLALTRRPA